MAKRRGHGEGSISQRHDHPSCPPPVDGVRPEHRCQGRWVAMVDLGYVDGKRRRKALYADTRKGAAIKLQETLAAKKSGSLAVGQVNVERWLTYWLDVVCAEEGLKVNTMKSHRSKVNTWLIPHLGHHRLDRLQPEHVRALYAAMRRQEKSEATVRQVHAILRRALAVAVRERKVPYNVAELVQPPKTTKRKRAGLTVAQARHVLDGSPLRWWLALYLGMRQGECLALRWSDVNLDEGWLFVQRNLVRIPGEGLAYDTPKSRASVRVVPLPPAVWSRFKVAWAEHLAAGGAVDGLVFHRGNGEPIDHRADWQAWVDLLTAKDVPHIALHAARNTTASLLEAAGVPARMVAEILGQATVEVTYNYQSADLDRRRDAMLALESLLDEEVGPTPGGLPGGRVVGDTAPDE